MRVDVRPSSVVKGFRANMYCLCALVGGAFVQDSTAQRRVVVESGDFGVLNEVVEGDTLANGDRVDEGTIYVLQRGMTYWLNGSLQNPGFHLRLEAEEGDGHPPVIRPGVDITGAAQRAFVVRGDLTASGIYFSNLDDFGAKQQQLFRVTADSITIRLDNVWMEWDQQSFFSYQTGGNSTFVTNSRGRNVGIRTGAGNGRIFDTRGNNQDSLVVENSTFYAFVNRPMLASGAVINYVKWNHNTLVDVHRYWQADRTIEQHITNNIFVNFNYAGSNDPFPENEHPSQSDVIFRVDSIGTLPSGLSDEDRRFVFRNNLFYRDQELMDLNTEFGVTESRLYDTELTHWLSLGVIASADNTLDYHEHDDVLEFVDRPPLPVEFRRAFLEGSEDPNFPWFQDYGDERLETSVDQWRNFTYQTEALAYTFADDGFPLGDLNWFPDKKAEWEAAQAVAIEDEDAALPQRFHLVGNYPNPFNPSTDVVFDVVAPMEITLHVYDLLGKKVRTMNLGNRIAGRHVVSFDATGLASGMYVLQMHAEGQAQSIRVLLLK